MRENFFREKSLPAPFQKSFIYNNRIKSGHEIVDYDGTHYTFLYWKDESGKKVTGDQEFICTGEDYEATYTAVYEEEIIGNFTLEYNDAFGHSSGNWSSEKNYGVDFNHTFRVPADIPDGAVFLYWEREDNG